MRAETFYLATAGVMLAAAATLAATAGISPDTLGEATGLSAVAGHRLAAVAALGGLFILVLDRCVRTDGAEGLGAAVLVLSALAALVRAPGLDIGLWRDESSTFFNSHWTSLAELSAILLETELNPPSYFLLMGGWVALFGGGEIALKAPSFIAGVLLTPAVYLLGRSAGSWRIGLFAAFLVTIAPPSIYYAQEARPYTWPALVACLAMSAYLGAIHGRRPWVSAAALALLGGLVCYSHYAGLILMGALGGASVVLGIIAGGARRFAPSIAGVLGAIVLFIPWTPTFIVHLDASAPWTEIAPLLMRPVIFLRNLAFILPWPTDRYVSGAACLLLIGYAFLTLAMRFMTRDPAHVRAIETRLALIAAVLGPAAGLAYLSLQGRYMFPFAPAACVLLALMIRDVLKGLRPHANAIFPAALAASVVIWTAFGAQAPLRIDEVDKSGIRALAQGITPQDASSTLYVLAPDFLGPTFGYYTRDRDVTAIGFARLDRPEIFRPLDYAEVWARPDVIEEVERRIDVARDQGRTILALVRSNCGQPENDRGSMRYSRTALLTERIAARFDEIESREYYGTWECVMVTTYALE
jgi:4-amino-4-deoxy-L-arabinose transferase-like glycosyltransferase